MPSYDQVMLKRGYRKITPIEYQEALGRPNESVFLWHRIEGFDYREESDSINTTDLNLLLNSTTHSVINSREDASTSEATLPIHQSRISEELPAPNRMLLSVKATIHDYPFRYSLLSLVHAYEYSSL